ncbi:MAG TPA: hypothetical protein VMS22_08985 [Candidatus Eisenbacteria bacterium]|nr:hypothetical protein [Candidatus Eisenbacteria bacterium]
MSRPRNRLLVLHIVGQYPMAGVAWQAIHYLLGFQRLGWDVYYVEDSGAAPYDPEAASVTGECSYAVRYVGDVMGRVGFGDRWVYLDMMKNETHGMSRAKLDELYRDATAIVNLCGATAPRAEHKQGAKLIYVETDPVYEQLNIALGDASSLGFLRSHDVLFTYGENLGAPDCPVPLREFTWHTTRPPVVMDCWDTPTNLAAKYFTTVASFSNKGKDITYDGVTYQWSKHENFLRFLDLPRRTPQPFLMAMKPLDPGIERRVRDAGWEMVDPDATSRDVDGYRRFIQESRGEFTVAKDIYVRPRSGWFSDRSVCYLAAGKPVVTQDSAFGKFVPTGEGLFAYATMEEAVDALACINADYGRHSAAARRVAAEHFGVEPVLRRMLADAGLA